MLSFRRRRVPPAQPVTSQGSSENPLFETNDPQALQRFRRTVLLSLAGILALGGLGLSTFGPWFTITNISVTGTRKLNPASVKQASEKYIAGRRWLLLPKNNLIVLSAAGLTKHLEQKIHERLAIEGVFVKKEWPHHLSVTVAERTPVALWSNDSIWGSIDRQGTIIETIQPPTAEDTSVRIIDDTKETFTVGQQVIDRQVMSAVATLGDLFKQANFAYTAIHIPAPSCPLPVSVVPTTNSNSNANTNVSNTNASANTNTEEDDTTTNSALNTNEDVVELPPCDLVALKKNSLEIHVQLADGPRVYFDRHQDLRAAVNALQRVITENKASGASYIDVRFPERVYVK